jgi:hypothetical protein
VVTVVTDAGGDTLGWKSSVNTTGWENYRVIVDTPNGTVISVERVEHLPEWVEQVAVTAVSLR